MKSNPSYKWLDIRTLFTKIINEKNKSSKIETINYFTAPIQAKLSKDGVRSCENQQNYIACLEHQRVNNLPVTPKINIIQGSYKIRKGEYYSYEDPVNFDNKISVWVAEEKKTDVAIASELIKDAFKNEFEQAVIVSNDSDLAPALEIVKKEFPEKLLGLIAPISSGSKSNLSSELKKNISWHKRGFSNEELKQAQLPDTVITRKRKIIKPNEWM